MSTLKLRKECKSFGNERTINTSKNKNNYQVDVLSTIPKKALDILENNVSLDCTNYYSFSTGLIQTYITNLIYNAGCLF
jgi:hypothetical protein